MIALQGIDTVLPHKYCNILVYWCFYHPFVVVASAAGASLSFNSHIIRNGWLEVKSHPFSIFYNLWPHNYIIMLYLLGQVCVCVCVCFNHCCSNHPLVIYWRVWHQVSLLHAVPVKLNGVAIHQHWQRQTRAHTNTCMTMMHDFITRTATRQKT